jgi:hypothetical protein
VRRWSYPQASLGLLGAAAVAGEYVTGRHGIWTTAFMSPV